MVLHQNNKLKDSHPSIQPEPFSEFYFFGYMEKQLIYFLEYVLKCIVIIA